MARAFGRAGRLNTMAEGGTARRAQLERNVAAMCAMRLNNGFYISPPYPLPTHAHYARAAANFLALAAAAFTFFSSAAKGSPPRPVAAATFAEAAALRLAAGGEVAAVWGARHRGRGAGADGGAMI